MIHLITGGARSGKSTFVLQEVERIAPEPATIAFIATARPIDVEMEERIVRHRAERSARFVTIEEPVDLPAALSAGAAHAAIIVDCLTVWLSNVMFSPGGEDDAVIEQAIGALVAAVVASPVPVLLVTNEVGMGIVPMNALSRRYRDHLGRCNQRLAAAADRVSLLVAGIPMSVKS